MKQSVRNILYTCYLLLATCATNAQELYYQNTYKGGVSYDGKSYYSLNWTVPDTIHFQNSVPAGCTIKKAFLISFKGSCLSLNDHPVYDIPVSFQYNGNTIKFDTADNATPMFLVNTVGIYAQNWMAVKDVTTLTQTNNNMLATPCQACNPNVCSKEYQYDGFYLLVLYENNTYSNVNVALYLNNMTYIQPAMNYVLTGLNPINTTNDVGLSIESVGDDIAPYLQYQLTSSVTMVTLGTLRDVSLSGNIEYNTAMGSFYYQNGILTGFNGSTNSPFIDSTDALCNIKTYLPNNANSFSLTALTATVSTIDDYNNTAAFVMAYSTPCPAVPNSVDSIPVYKLCAGQSTQLNASTGYASYNWFPSTSLSDSNTANPMVQHAQYSTNYICAVTDAAGCMHTEHAQVIVHSPPAPQSHITTSAVCGGPTQGMVNITPNIYNYGYTYSLSTGATSTDTTFGNLSAGHYTLTVTDSFNCSYKTSFIIKDTNYASASFFVGQSSNCAPATIDFNVQVQNTTAQEWYVNGGDSSSLLNPNYTFADSGKYVITLIAWNNLRQCSDTTSKTIYVKYCPPPPPDSISITVPNVFSPNADDINDTWQLIIYNRNYTISNYQCTIYDRWGLKVFSADSSTSLGMTNGWDGRTTSGLACSADTYFYIVRLTATNSLGIAQQKEFKGFLQLVR